MNELIEKIITTLKEKELKIKVILPYESLNKETRLLIIVSDKNNIGYKMHFKFVEKEKEFKYLLNNMKTLTIPLNEVEFNDDFDIIIFKNDSSDIITYICIDKTMKNYFPNLNDKKNTMYINEDVLNKYEHIINEREYKTIGKQGIMYKIKMKI